MKNSIKWFIAGSVLALSACASAPEPDHEIAFDPSLQARAGFQQLETRDTFQKFSLGHGGEFIISKERFSLRDNAAAFCRLHEGFELSDWLLPGMMALNALPFEDLRKSNMISRPVLGGAGGEGRTGLIFWVQGKNAEEEKQYAKGTDFVYEMLNGCGRGCKGVESLSVINSRLLKFGEAPVAPQAICTDARLRNRFSR